jgi:hypothetical protein
MHIPIETVDSIPGSIEPIDLKFDRRQIARQLDLLYEKTGFDKYSPFRLSRQQNTFNLNHPYVMPKEIIEKNGEFARFHGNISVDEGQLVEKYGLGVRDFVVMDPMVSSTYLGEVYRQVRKWHDTNQADKGLLNRYQTTLLANGAGYQLHVDQHTTIRYHIAVTTNRFCYMMSEHDGVIKAVHIPADGRVWMLDTRVMHTALNIAPNKFSQDDRIRNHIIISVSQPLTTR